MISDQECQNRLMVSAAELYQLPIIKYGRLANKDDYTNADMPEFRKYMQLTVILARGKFHKQKTAMTTLYFCMKFTISMKKNEDYIFSIEIQTQILQAFQVVAQNSSLVAFKTKYTATNKKIDRHNYRKVSKEEQQNIYRVYIGGVCAVPGCVRFFFGTQKAKRLFSNGSTTADSKNRWYLQMVKIGNALWVNVVILVHNLFPKSSQIITSTVIFSPHPTCIFLKMSAHFIIIDLPMYVKNFQRDFFLLSTINSKIIKTIEFKWAKRQRYKYCECEKIHFTQQACSLYKPRMASSST